MGQIQKRQSCNVRSPFPLLVILCDVSSLPPGGSLGKSQNCTIVFDSKISFSFQVFKTLEKNLFKIYTAFQK